MNENIKKFLEKVEQSPELQAKFSQTRDPPRRTSSPRSFMPFIATAISSAASAGIALAAAAF